MTMITTKAYGKILKMITEWEWERIAKNKEIFLQTDQSIMDAK